MSSGKITVTKNYRLFIESADNRPIDVKRHKKLKQSMEKYGYLKSFPIVCVRDAKGSLIVKDGQHRLRIAESLGLPVAYVVESVDFDIATINCTSKVWAMKDFALMHAANGRKSYEEGLAFSSEHGLPIGIGFAMLGGMMNFSSIKSDFIDGTFKVKDREWANRVAAIYVPLTKLSPVMHNDRFLQACMAVCRVPEFSGPRLLQGAERCRDKLASYSSREAYLNMIEEVYNFGRSKLFGLKAAATMILRKRQEDAFATKNGKAKQKKAAS